MELNEKKLLEMERFFCQAELTRGLLHEINNSLTGILGFAQLLINSAQDREEESRDLKAIEEEALQCRKMIQSFLNLFQQVQEVEGPLEMNALLEDLLSPLQDQREFLHIDLIKELSPDGLYFQGSLPEWRILLMGLLLEAVHAAGKKGILKVITSKKEAGATFQIVIESLETRVQKDTELRPFIPFGRSRKKVVALGVYLVQHAAKQAGGALKVEHLPRGGCAISLSLPMVAGR